MQTYRSTFPLNNAAIAREALGQIFGDPVTWVPLLPAVAAYTLFDVPIILALIVELAVLAALVAYWRVRWGGMIETLRRKKIAEHNRAQDAMLSATVAELRQSGAQSYAERLKRFLQIKQEVEQRLHEDGTITEQKVQLERLVDSLCFSVSDQLSALAHRGDTADASDRAAILADVDAALQTLQTTAAELDTILGPVAATDGTLNSIEDLTQRLREETEIARRVKARLRAEYSVSPPSEPPRMESN
jgi:hypothetical protein